MEEVQPVKESNEDIVKAAVQYEWEALGQYDTLLQVATDPTLRSILERNRKEELDHVNALMGWLNKSAPYALENALMYPHA